MSHPASTSCDVGVKITEEPEWVLDKHNDGCANVNI